MLTRSAASAAPRRAVANWRTHVDRLDQIIVDAGFPDFRWTDGSKLAVGQWVRMKCIYACDNFGLKANCPPNIPSVEECERFFSEYERVAVIHLQITGGEQKYRESRKTTNEKLIALERDVFLAGYHKTMVLLSGTCSVCSECATTREKCAHPDLGRPTPEALAMDVFATARSVGYPIEVLTDRSQTLNRYAFLFVE
jgi:predicted metal-binding protein